MEFLGKPSDELRKIKSQLIAQEALLRAIVLSLQGPSKDVVLANFHIQAEKMRADCLHSMATDSLNDELQNQLKNLADIFTLPLPTQGKHPAGTNPCPTCGGHHPES